MSFLSGAPPPKKNTGSAPDKGREFNSLATFCKELWPTSLPPASWGFKLVMFNNLEIFISEIKFLGPSSILL